MSKTPFRPTVFLLISLLCLPLMISNESLWIDEGCTALFVLQPNLHAWWIHLSTNSTSDSQMPLSNLVSWFAGRFLGSEEWQLRAVNGIWGAIALCGGSFVGRKLAINGLPLLLAAQPYFWFYMNEARPYLLQVAAGTWLLAGFVCFVLNRGAGRRWAFLFGGAAVVLVYTTMLAPISLVPMVAVGAVIAYRQRWPLEKRAVLILLIAGLLTLPAGWHYVTSFERGARGAMLWPIDAKYLPYIVYEIGGFSGLGPALSDLRELASGQQFKPWLQSHSIDLLALGLFGISLAGISVFGFKAWREHHGDRISAALGGVLLFALCLFFAASVVAEKPFWGRHFAPIFPFYAALLGWGIDRSAPLIKPAVHRAVIGTFCLLLIASSVSIRCAPRHRKEDYRAAATMAREAVTRGESVWWVAAPEAAEYYGVPLSYDRARSGMAFCPHRKDLKASPVRLAELPVADLVIVSEREAFDTIAEARQLVTLHGLRPSAAARGFAFFRR